MKLWIDSVRPAPNENYASYKTVSGVAYAITLYEEENIPIDVIDIGDSKNEPYLEDYDYCLLLQWLEDSGRNYPIRIHSFDIQEKKKMREIMERNGWEEV